MKKLEELKKFRNYLASHPEIPPRVIIELDRIIKELEEELQKAKRTFDLKPFSSAIDAGLRIILEMIKNSS